MSNIGYCIQNERLKLKQLNWIKASCLLFTLSAFPPTWTRSIVRTFLGISKPAASTHHLLLCEPITKEKKRVHHFVAIETAQAYTHVNCSYSSVEISRNICGLVWTCMSSFTVAWLSFGDTCEMCYRISPSCCITKWTTNIAVFCPKMYKTR